MRSLYSCEQGVWFWLFSTFLIYLFISFSFFMLSSGSLSVLPPKGTTQTYNLGCSCDVEDILPSILNLWHLGPGYEDHHVL